MHSIVRAAFFVLFLIEFLTFCVDESSAVYTFQPNVNRELYECSGGRIRDRAHITGDGNCLFRSISYCFYGTENSHADVRARIVSYVADNWDYYGRFARHDHGVNTAREYRNKMSADKEWGSDVELSAATMVFELDFRVYGSNGKYYMKDAVDNTEVAALFYDNEHYDVVEDREI